MNDKLKSLTAEGQDYVVSLRRHFHMYPELGGQEHQTQQKIMAELTSFGLSPRKAAGTGVIAELTGALPGRTVALRADIDALPVADENEVTYRSRNAGTCHACGHDGHTAMLLGVAKVLTSMKDELPGTVRFLFQPSEEKLPGGALPLIEAGALDGVDAILGAHLWQPLAVGTIGITYGPMMASCDEFAITVQGRGGHGSMPHQTIDALLVGAQLVVALNTIVSRNVDPVAAAAMSIGTFQSGEVFNIIPDTAIIKGTVRSLDRAVRENIVARIEQITEGVCTAAGAGYQLEKLPGYPPVINDPEVAKVLAEAGRETLGDKAVAEIKPVMGSEDFSYYQEKVPGAFMFIGAGNPEQGLVYPHHHPRFDIDETALSNGVGIMVRAALKLLAR